MDKTTVLITGGSGKLGKELVKAFQTIPGTKTVAPTSKEMNVISKIDVHNAFERYHPNIIIHAAAMTNVRECQDNWQHAERVNVNGTVNIAKMVEKTGAKLIYISTACVFDGENGPYSETDRPGPKNWYAMTKLIGEKFVLQNPNNLVVRTNFVAREPWPYPGAFVDRKGTYLFAHDVARAIPKVMHMNGVVHVCGDKDLTMFELARLTTPEVEPITVMGYTGPPLTMDMRLKSNRIPSFCITGYSGECIK